MPGAARAARRVREAVQRNGSIERRDRALGRLHHRLFSHITANWRGRPLTSHEVVVNAIASTTTRSGLRVQAELDPRPHPLGVAISKARMDALPLQRHEVRGTWNYTLHPAHTDQTPPAPAPVGAAPASDDRTAALNLLDDPRLTGMSKGDLDALAARLAPAQQAQWEQRRYEARGGPDLTGRRSCSPAATAS
ncbi:hypothetical protein [Streptomyces sp. NPDC091217]|uniref:ISAzo13-like element transposase-related protein n=1 Tax=Streptomyces sp. NPDC091217 TaxID=3365975 RepID=UPI0037FAD059